VTDDFSINDNVEVCRKWIEENNTMFLRTELIAFEKSTGIPKNHSKNYLALDQSY